MISIIFPTSAKEPQSLLLPMQQYSWERDHITVDLEGVTNGLLQSRENGVGVGAGRVLPVTDNLQNSQLSGCVSIQLYLIDMAKEFKPHSDPWITGSGLKQGIEEFKDSHVKIVHSWV